MAGRVDSGAFWTAVLCLGVGCQVPIELVGEIEGTTTMEGEGSTADNEDASETDGGDETSEVEDCPTGALDCPCASDDMCEEGLVCAEGTCVVLTTDCGNGTVDQGEDCDDGNLTDADGCNADCSASGAMKWSTSFVIGQEGTVASLVAVDSTDAVVVAGADFELYAGYVRKLAATGEEVWTQALPDDTFPNDLAIAPTDAVFVGGAYYVPGGFGDFGSYWAGTFDPDGSEGAVHDVNWDQIGAVAVTGDGTLVTGAGPRFYAHSSNESWHWESNEWVVSMAATADGGFVAVTGVDVVDSQVFRYGTPAAEPEPQWVIEGPPQPVDLALDDAGNLVIVGHNTLVNGTTGWLRKLAPDGSELWLQDLGLQNESPVAIAVDSNARIVVVLESETETKLRKYDSAGSPLWTITPEPSRRIRDAAIDSSDGIVVAGSMDLAGPEPSGAAWVACFSP